MIIKIAVKNIMRNKRRTILTSLAMILGIASLLIFTSFISEQMKGFREGIIREGLGHIQIASNESFFSKGKFDPSAFIIDNSDSIELKIKSNQDVINVIPSIGFSAMAAGKNKTITLLIKAYPRDKIHFSKDQNETVNGQISPSFLIHGNNFSPETDEIIIGDLAAKILGIKCGEILTIMSILPGGALKASDFTVCGIYKGSESGKIYAYIPYESRGKLIDAESPSSFTLFLSSENQTDKVTHNIKNSFPELTIKPWHQLAEFYTQVNGMYSAFLKVISAIMILVTVFVVMNTMSMSVFERIREIGTMRAVGTSRKRIFSMLSIEGFCLGIFGSFVGIVFGFLLSFAINALGGIPFSYDGFDYHILISPDFSDAIKAALPVLFVSLLGTLPAAYKGSRLSVAETLRY
ncbi:MAG: ABC transporter permease [Spirochaetes bacterium]|nr:ABC transporter permease [Spirochaetota bacterium]